MITIDLNNYDESKTCGDIARELIITGSDPSTIVRFMRGKTKVFLNDSPLNYWAATAVEESTKGEWISMYSIVTGRLIDPLRRLQELG